MSKLARSGIACLAFVGLAVPVVGQSPIFSRATVAVSGAPRAIVSADFNNDGRMDLAVAATTGAAASNPGVITILANDRLGGFMVASTLATQAGPFSIAAGDVNNDGASDLAVVDADAAVVEVFTHEPGTSFEFRLASTFTTPPSPRGIVLGDLNRDGRLDMVVTALGCDCIEVALGQGDGEFLSSDRRAVWNAPIAVTLQDLSHDGRLDIVTLGSSGITIWLNAGGGHLATRLDQEIGVPSQAMHLADLNANGRPELFTVGSFSVGGHMMKDLNQYGSGGTGLFYTGGRDPRAVAMVDITGDGTPDLVSANRGSGTIGVSVATTLSTTDSCGIYPGFRAPVLVRVGDGSRAVAIADFNADGRPDIATADEYAHTATILLNGTAFAGRP